MVRTPEERRSGDVATGPAELRMRLRCLLDRVALGDEPLREPALGPYLTVSREVASGGTEVAIRVGERLGWKVLGRELVQDLAHQLELDPRLLDLMDETRVGWFSETLLNLFNSRGRAANLILPPEKGLRVRIVAPREFRVAALVDREGLELRAAGNRLDKIDDSRAEFVRRHFRIEAADPYYYDLVIDTFRFGIGASADLICRALEVRGLTEAAP